MKYLDSFFGWDWELGIRFFSLFPFPFFLFQKERNPWILIPSENIGILLERKHGFRISTRIWLDSSIPWFSNFIKILGSLDLSISLFSLFPFPKKREIHGFRISSRICLDSMDFCFHEDSWFFGFCQFPIFPFSFSKKREIDGFHSSGMKILGILLRENHYLTLQYLILFMKYLGLFLLWDWEFGNSGIRVFLSFPFSKKREIDGFPFLGMEILEFLLRENMDYQGFGFFLWILGIGFSLFSYFPFPNSRENMDFEFHQGFGFFLGFLGFRIS